MIFCVDRSEPRRTHFTLLVRLEPVQRSTADTEGDLEPCQPDVVVDGMKCCGQVEQGEHRHFQTGRRHRLHTECPSLRQYFSARPSRYVSDMQTAWRDRRSAADRYSCRAAGKQCAREVWTPAINWKPRPVRTWISRREVWLRERRL